MKTHLSLLLVLVSMLGSSARAEHPYLKAFPPAKKGMKRYVIILPDKARAIENNFRVELIVGREMLTDGVNKIRLGGKIEAKPLKGWGFTYFEVAKLGPAMTLIGVPPGTPKVPKFVVASTMLVGYNSRVPLVIYVPNDGEVRYRIWKAPDKSEKAKQG